MARTIASEVKQIIATDLPDETVNAFILSANYVVSDVLGSDTTITDGHKIEIERWMAAHLLACSRERHPTKEKAGKAEITYQGITGQGLKSTLYGQQVLVLDTTGKMAQLSKKPATIMAITSFD